MTGERDVLTPEQAADYLQLNRETIYRYIRAGTLGASKLGRAYRIPRASLDLLLYSTQTTPGVGLRRYTNEQVEGFIADDELTPEQHEVAHRLGKVASKRSTKPITEERLAHTRT
ncbi:MAG: helix-turn-helix domain-containing protein [Chloroflexota bacterium]